MNIKEARTLVESHKKLDPDYAEAVRICIEDDKIEAGKEIKVEVEVEEKFETEIIPEETKVEVEVKTGVNDG